MQGGQGVLILGLQRLVVLETPKTGSLALRAMLAAHTLPASDEVPRHIGHSGFVRNHAPQLSHAFGGEIQTVAVVRNPLCRLQSWFRYRMRENVAHLPVSTQGLRFEEFMQAYLQDPPPKYANVGRQDRFVGWNGKMARVDHVFDYRRLDLLEAFFSERTGDRLVMPTRNVTPKTKPVDYSLSPAVEAAFLAQSAEELALYAAVSETGYLRRAGLI